MEKLQQLFQQFRGNGIFGGAHEEFRFESLMSPSVAACEKRQPPVATRVNIARRRTVVPASILAASPCATTSIRVALPKRRDSILDNIIIPSSLFFSSHQESHSFTAEERANIARFKSVVPVSQL